MSRSAFKQNLKTFVNHSGLHKAGDGKANDIVSRWKGIQSHKETINDCGWDEILAELHTMKSLMKEATVPQTDIDFIQFAIRDLKAIRTRLQELYVHEGSTVDQLETLWGLEAGALDD